jgi:hypothetical protein
MAGSVKTDIAASHRTRLGCSKIAQALGLSRWGTAYQLWEQYTGKAPWPNIGHQLRVALGEPMETVLKPHVEGGWGVNCAGIGVSICIPPCRWSAMWTTAPAPRAASRARWWT